MDPFEEQLRDLPWRKPSRELRERLFPPEENPVVRGALFARIPLGWAAVLVVAVSVFAYTRWPTAETPAIVTEKDLEPLEIASTQHFFDLSSPTDEVWSALAYNRA